MPIIHEVRVPKLGMSVDSATLTEWLVDDGQRVDVGMPLYVVATDKADQEITCSVGGTVRLIGAIDETYAVGTVIAEITTP
jgi:pyruvate/2-oxoglutarate dehydrogenase complex dihydrolipoamide acyltransferase (E2) component